MNDVYLDVAQQVSRLFTKRYSTSFGLAASLFAPVIRQDIYNIYGYVRVADEIVDTYAAKDSLQLLDAFETQTYQDLDRGYSTNPVIHAFITTCRKVHITKELIEPFIASMRIDARPKSYKTTMYEAYIYGSAEVVGLMCLKVFVMGNDEQYAKLQAGARALGSAYQKVNFLRDIADDYQRLGRYYFPEGSYKTFNEKTKQKIVADILADFTKAEQAIDQLPKIAKRAVRASYVYYLKLLRVVQQTPAEELKNRRVRVADWQKLLLLIRIKVTGL